MVPIKLWNDFSHDYMAVNPNSYEFVKYGYVYNERQFLTYQCIYLNNKEVKRDTILYRKKGLTLATYTIPPFICPNLIDDFNEIAEEIESKCRILNGYYIDNPLLRGNKN